MPPPPPAPAGGRVNFPPRPGGKRVEAGLSPCVQRTPRRHAPSTPRREPAATSGNAPLSLSPGCANRPDQPPSPRPMPSQRQLPHPRAAASSSGRFHVGCRRRRAGATPKSSTATAASGRNIAACSAASLQRPSRRPRRQKFLPRHGQGVRDPGAGRSAVQQPEVGRQRLRCASQLIWPVLAGNEIICQEPAAQST